MSRQAAFGVRALPLLCVVTLTAPAATSTSWQITGFTDFLKGRLSGLSLSADGTLQLGPSLRWQAALDQPALWTFAIAPDRSLYAATGHSGKIFHITANGKSSVTWSAAQSEVFALCISARGVLYAGTSPNGGIYRIENGKAAEIWHSPAKYIWAIQPGADGALYAATGEPGRIYRIASDSRAELYYETGQSNVTALVAAANGHLYAGTDPNGIIYDIASAGKASVLYDSNLPEIRALAIASDGSIYAAAMGGAVSTRTTTPPSAAGAPTAVVAVTPTVITVTEAAGAARASENDQASQKAAAEQSKPPASPMSSGATSNTAVVEVAGVEKSAIYRINPNHTVETLRSSKEDNVYDIQLLGNSLVFSTDDHGRVYRLENGRTILLAEAGDGETTRLLQSEGVLYAALSNSARLCAFGAAGTGPGSYESPVHDSTSVAHWGHIRWHLAPSASSAGIAFRTRTGNAARPDNTWSPWSRPISDPDQALIQSPVARFIQWRAEWAEGSTVQITGVEVPYLPQNAPPVVHSIAVSSILSTNPAKSSTTSVSSSAAYSVTVTDTGQPAPATTASSELQTASRLQSTQTQISWQADDPDGDKLVYSVYFRAEDEHDWQLIRSRMFENTLLLDPDVFADGRYFFRVVASDAPSNAAEYAREAEMISTPVLIDNTPPMVTLSSPQREGSTLDIDVDATDKTSPLRLCEYSLDAGFWQPIEAVDGVTDSPHERFHLHLDKLRPGEHLLVFRVYDTANNAGLARVVLR
ncbi:MAG: hypothetical protein JO091_13905 [Acidobacteriaceae bacterium]|nr:hypothetical protein [Acidobacteriaceae bacterium]